MMLEPDAVTVGEAPDENSSGSQRADGECEVSMHSLHMQSEPSDQVSWLVLCTSLFAEWGTVFSQ